MDQNNFIPGGLVLLLRILVSVRSGEVVANTRCNWYFKYSFIPVVA
jgi:hypothetical protein